MRRTIATVSLSGTLTTKLAAIAAAGFDGVEVFDNDLVASLLRPADVAARCADLGLSVDLYQPLRDLEGVDPARFPAVLGRVARKLDSIVDLGAPMVLVCSNVAPDAIADVDLSAGQLHAVGELARERGLTVAYEALAWGRHVNRLREAWTIVERADHPAVGLAVDTFHVLARGDHADAVADIPGERIFFLQVADAPWLEMGLLGWSRHHRCFPGQGMLDVVGLVDSVLRAGYLGPLSLEVFSDVVRCADPQATALDAVRSLYGLEEELGRRWSAGGPRRAPAAAAAEPLFAAPPPPSGLEFGFVEVAVEPRDDALLDQLRVLGFARVGTHRSKPVEWWRNGDAHLVLNFGAPATGTGHADKPAATAVGLVVGDVAAVAARTAALLWPEVQPARGRNEALLPGTVTPGGLQVFLSGPPGTGDHWQGDFVLEPGPVSGTFAGLDHIGLEISAERLEEETSFYRAVLGMHASPLVEFIEPHGRLLSRVVQPVDPGPRIVLNVEDRAQADGRRLGPNQIAFATRDLLGEVGRLRRAGVRFLAIPDNYYDDLAYRFDMDPNFVARLRDNRVLYDRTPDGEFLHAYTGFLAPGCYVELLQRIGGYAGFGAPNTHVRLSRQTEEMEMGPVSCA